MSRTLATNTTVEGTTYKAGTVPPPEVAELIDNPKAWGDDTSATDEGQDVEQLAEIVPAGSPLGPDPDDDEDDDESFDDD